MDLTFENIDNNRLCVKYVGKIHIENSNDINAAIKENVQKVIDLMKEMGEIGEKEEPEFITRYGIPKINDRLSGIIEKLQNSIN